MFRSAAFILAVSLIASPTHAQDSQPSSQPTDDAAPAKAAPPAAENAPPTKVAPSSEDQAPAAHEAQHGAKDGADVDTDTEAPLVEDDLLTRMELFRRGGFSLQLGGMIQVQGAAYVGDEAALEFDDPADTEGFRVRRARFGVSGTLATDWGYYLAVDLKDAVVAAQGGDQGNEILDATIEWRRYSFARVSAGVDKVPYSALALNSSSKLVLIERPLMLRHVVPERRVGLTVEGDIWRLQYAAGLYNGSDGVTSGNRMAGLAGAAHVQFHVLGRPRGFVPDGFRVSLGGGYMYEDGPAVNAHRFSGNLLVQFYKARLQGEFLWMQTSPDQEPTGGPIEAGDASRWGVAGELSAFVWQELVQVAVRYEYYKDVEDLPTFGTQQLITAGVNVYLYRDAIKMQLNYINRDEREGPTVANDIAFAQLQAMF